MDSVVSEGFSNLNIPQFRDCGVCQTPAAHPDIPPKSQGPAFPCIPASPLLPTTALPPPCPWEVTSVTRCRPALHQEKGLACHHRRHIVTGHEDNTTCFIPKMTWETPFSCSFTKFWGPSQPGWPRTEASTSWGQPGPPAPRARTPRHGVTAEGQDPQRPAGTARPKGHNGHTTPKSMENREEPQQGGGRPIWQQLWTRLKSIFDTQELL